MIPAPGFPITYPYQAARKKLSTIISIRSSASSRSRSISRRKYSRLSIHFAPSHSSSTVVPSARAIRMARRTFGTLLPFSMSHSVLVPHPTFLASQRKLTPLYSLYFRTLFFICAIILAYFFGRMLKTFDISNVFCQLIAILPEICYFSITAVCLCCHTAER